MPIRADQARLYPRDWGLRSRLIRHVRAGGYCEWCAAANHRPHPVTGSLVVLTVAHLDHHPANNQASNLVALCQRCHNTYDAPMRSRGRRHRAGQQTLDHRLPAPDRWTPAVRALIRCRACHRPLPAAGRLCLCLPYQPAHPDCCPTTHCDHTHPNGGTRDPDDPHHQHHQQRPGHRPRGGGGGAPWGAACRGEPVAPDPPTPPRDHH